MFRKSKRDTYADSVSATFIKDKTEEVYLTPKEAKRLLKESRRRDKERAALQKRRKKGKAAPRSVQEKIRYEAMYEDGICMVAPGEYSSTISFSDINYQNLNTGDQMSIFERYCEMLNYFDESCALQYTIFNSKAGEGEKGIFFNKPQTDDGLNCFREEFNDILRGKAAAGRSDRILEHYLTFLVAEKNKEGAGTALARIEKDITDNLAQIGSKSRHLNGTERLELINAILWPGEPFIFDYRALLSSSLRTKDAISPMAITIPKTPANVIRYGDTYARILSLTAKTAWPSDLSDRMISELTVLDVDMVINFLLKPIAQDKSLDMVTAKLVSMDGERHGLRRKAIKAGFDPDEMVPFELRDRLADAEELRDDLKSRNQKMFYGTFLVYLYANNLEDLEEATRRTKSAAYKLMYRLDAVECASPLIDALNSSLPLGKNWTGIKRTLLTVNAGIIIPFSTRMLQQKDGLYYGVEKESGKYIALNRLALKAPHGMYLGATGSGKSFGVKREIVQVLMQKPNAEIWISDPDNEYVPFVEMLGGQYLPIQPDSKIHLNLFDIAADPETGLLPFAQKSQFIMGICEEVFPAAPHEVALMRSIVDRCVIQVYEGLSLSGDSAKVPTLVDFLGVLADQEEEIAAKIRLALESYATGTMAQFGQRTNIDYSSRLFGLGMRETGDVFKGMAQHVTTDMLWNRMLYNYGRGWETWMYFDEFQTSLKSKTQSEYFLNIWARARKFGGVANAITQSPETVLRHEEARKALLNSPFVVLYDIPDPDEVAGLFGLSQKQLKYITNPKAGSGLYRVEEILVPFEDDFPRDTELYRAMTTKPMEAKR